MAKQKSKNYMNYSHEQLTEFDDLEKHLSSVLSKISESRDSENYLNFISNSLLSKEE